MGPVGIPWLALHRMVRAAGPNHCNATIIVGHDGTFFLEQAVEFVGGGPRPSSTSGLEA